MKTESSPFNTTLSVTPLSNQLWAGAIVGFAVFFILAVFQPFGTYGFQMRYKTLFLAGYGVICTFVYGGYYALTMTFLKRWFQASRWNAIRELLTLIPALVAMSMSGLYYHHAVIGGYSIHWGDIIYFLKMSLAVGIVPFSILFYMKWKMSRTITVESTANLLEAVVTIESNNKKEKSVVAGIGNLLFLKSNGNYIEIATQEAKGVKTHLIRKSLSQVEGKLPESLFLKLHRSYIVNLDAVTGIGLRGSSYYAKIRETDIEIPISRAMVKEVRDRLNTIQ